MASATLAQELAASKAPLEPPPSAADALASDQNGFVINLVSSTTPVALTRPDHAGLKRFTFFVSRRREEGRERFRLHMGYFDSQEEAERLLDIVRGIYPGAWAGLAPGRRLADRIAAASASRAAEVPAAAASPQSASAAAPRGTTPAPAPAPQSASASAAAAPVRVPIASVATLSPRAARPSPPTAVASRPPARSIPTLQPALSLVPDEGRRLIVDVTQDAERNAAARSLSNIREAIASLDASTASAPTVNPLPELPPATIPTVQPVERTALPAEAAGRRKGERTAEQTAALSNSGVLRVLEGQGEGQSDAQSRRAAVAAQPAAAAPDATPSERSRPPVRQAQQTPHTEKPYFAVQLLWSVEPLSMSRVPQLAIFSAYTLYGAQGNRDGRRWYGLRLGFFTDAISARQVAQYVRGDFATVSVVPVTARERVQALQTARVLGSAHSGEAKAATAAVAGAVATPAAPVAGAARAAAPNSEPLEGTFKLIDDRSTQPLKHKAADTPRASGAWRPRPAPGKRAKPRKPGQIHGRARARPKTLEETLEILGANELQVADEPGASKAKLGAKAGAKPSKLSRLFERLSERLGD